MTYAAAVRSTAQRPPPMFPVKDSLVQQYDTGGKWDMEDCSCLQMSDTSVWFVAPKAGDSKYVLFSPPVCADV
jgi:hypothetical protein